MQGTIDGIRRWTRKNWANKVMEWTNVTMPDHGNAEKDRLAWRRLQLLLPSGPQSIRSLYSCVHISILVTFYFNELLLMNLLFTSFQPSHYCAVVMTYSVMDVFTVVPAMGGHPWEQAKVSVHDRWPLIRGTGWWGCTKHITPCTTALCSTTREYIHSEYKH